MPSRSATPKLLTVLCVITLLVAQAFGGLTGYLCRCTGEQTVSLSDHCHGPHSVTVQDDADAAVIAGLEGHSDGTCDAGEEREDHSPLQVSLQSLQWFGASAPELVPFLVAVLTNPSLVEVLGSEAATRTWAGQVLPVQSPGVFFAKTTVLLM